MKLKLAIVATLALAAGGGAWGLVHAPFLRCTEVEVEGAQQASAAEVRHLADVAIGTPLLLADLHTAVAGVEQHPWIARAEARRELPNRLVIRVEERVPTALLMLDGLFVVDADGVVFRRADAQTADLPIITGISPDLARSEPEVARRLVREALSLLSGSYLQENSVSELHFDMLSGYTGHLRNGGELLYGFRPSVSSERLASVVRSGVDLSLPYRVDAGSHTVVVTPL